MPFGLDELREIKEKTGAQSVTLEVGQFEDKFEQRLTVVFPLQAISSLFDDPEEPQKIVAITVKQTNEWKARGA